MEPSSEPAWIEPLFQTVRSRPRPEDVAKVVVRTFPGSPHRKKWLQRAQGYSYMSPRYASATPLTKSANLLAYFIGRYPLTDEETLGAELFELLAAGREGIGAPATGALDFRHGRLDRAARAAKGVEMSRRHYNKLFRLIDFLERERAHGDLYVEICTLTRGAKTGVLDHLSREDFSRDAVTALFVAYMGARMGMRSKFTVDPQDRPYDDLAEALLEDMFRSETTHWFAAAHVFPRADVLARLDDAQKLRLLSYVVDQLRLAAKVLRTTAERSGIDYRKSCTVRRGQDSSSWNAAAGAWNIARDTWLGLSMALRLETESMVPGKVPRLMAADVVAWQRSVGQSAHPVELVAADLPLPWEVLLDGVACSAEDVRAACARHGVDPVKAGWTGALGRTAVEVWRPTPELVYGVTVGDPGLALMMRRMGCFSGPAKWERENFADR